MSSTVVSVIAIAIYYSMSSTVASVIAIAIFLAFFGFVLYKTVKGSKPIPPTPIPGPGPEPEPKKPIYEYLKDEIDLSVIQDTFESCGYRLDYGTVQDQYEYDHGMCRNRVKLFDKDKKTVLLEMSGTIDDVVVALRIISKDLY